MDTPDPVVETQDVQLERTVFLDKGISKLNSTTDPSKNPSPGGGAKGTKITEYLIPQTISSPSKLTNDDSEPLTKNSILKDETKPKEDVNNNTLNTKNKFAEAEELCLRRTDFKSNFQILSQKGIIDLIPFLHMKNFTANLISPSIVCNNKRSFANDMLIKEKELANILDNLSPEDIDSITKDYPGIIDKINMESWLDEESRLLFVKFGHSEEKIDLHEKETTETANGLIANFREKVSGVIENLWPFDKSSINLFLYLCANDDSKSCIKVLVYVLSLFYQCTKFESILDHPISEERKRNEKILNAQTKRLCSSFVSRMINQFIQRICKSWITRGDRIKREKINQFQQNGQNPIRFYVENMFLENLDGLLANKSPFLASGFKSLIEKLQKIDTTKSPFEYRIDISENMEYIEERLTSLCFKEFTFFGGIPRLVPLLK